MADANEIAKQLEELRKQIVEFQEQAAPIKAEEEAAREEEEAARRAYEAAVAAAREKRALADKKLFEVRSKTNQMQMEARRLEAALEEERQRLEAIAKAEAAKEQALTLEKNWDMLTAGASWREWAKDHQIKGGHKLTADKKVIVADPMGLGKTLTAIITCDMVEAATKEASPEFPFLGESKTVRKYIPANYDAEGNWVQSHYEDVDVILNGVDKPSGRKILYICPSPLLRNVEKEWRMWAKHRNVSIIGGMTKNERQFLFDFMLPTQSQYVVICNFEAWRKDLKLLEQLVACEFDTVIVDEAHNAKEIKSIAYRGIRQILDELQPPYIIPMTGTPILNRPQELFALLTMVNPVEFHNLNDFLFTYCEQDPETGFWKFKPGGLDLLNQKISKHFMRRTKDQAGIELPEKTITIHELEVDEEAYPNQARVREQMRKYATIMIDEAKGKALAATAIIAMFTRLRQIETWPAGIVQKDPLTKEVILQVEVEESQKIDYAISWDNERKEWNGLIPEIIEDERVVLFSQFKAPLHEIADRVNRMGKRAVILHGETPQSVRNEIMVDFDNRYTPDRTKARWDIVLCNYKVGGVGMNLTAATQMVILDEEWNPGKRDQAYDRIHRIGQDKPVTIHVIRNLKTIDDWLAGIMESKEGLVDGFQNAMISAADFKEALDSGLI